MEKDFQEKDLDFKYKDQTNEETFLSEVFRTKERDSDTQDSSTSYSDVAKTIKYSDIYGDYQIKISPKKIRAYLRNYNGLDKIIANYEKENIGIGPSFNEWARNDSSRVDNQAINLITNGHLKEMKFYKKQLFGILEYLKKYFFMAYQFIFLKYFKKESDKEISKVLDINDTEYLDTIIIQYIYEKLLHSFNKTKRSSGGK